MGSRNIAIADLVQQSQTYKSDLHRLKSAESYRPYKIMGQAMSNQHIYY